MDTHAMKYSELFSEYATIDETRNVKLCIVLRLSRGLLGIGIGNTMYLVFTGLFGQVECFIDTM